MKFPEAILAFRRSRYFRVFYLVILSLLVASLIPLLGPLGCLVFGIIPITMFVLPYWLKDRRPRVLAMNGLVIFVLASLIFAAIDTQAIASSDPVPVSTPGSGSLVSLTNATVAPGRGPPNAAYNFTAHLTDRSGRNATAFAVYVNLTKVEGLSAVSAPIAMRPVDPTDVDLRNGKSYYANVSVEDRVYFFWFSVTFVNATSTVWLQTPLQTGPVVTSVWTFFGLSLYIAFQIMLLPILFYFVLVFLFWFPRRRRTPRTATAVAREKGETGFMCTHCGSDVPEDAERCPKCGSVFEPQTAEEEGEEPDAKP